MNNFRFECSHNSKNTILLKIDGITVKSIFDGTKSYANMVLTEGNHEITVIKNSFLLKWYWWLNIFNLLYVFLRLKDRTGGCLGYDDDFASCTINILINNNDKATLGIALRTIDFNKNGRQGSYLQWDNLKGENLEIIAFNENNMPRKLIVRWRLVKGIPTPFYFLLVYVGLAYHIYNKAYAFDLPLGIFILFSASWAIYTSIRVFIEKSVEENLGELKK